MEARRTPTRWTYAEFARLPSEGGTRYEIVAGELVVTPAPGTRHQRIVTDLVYLLTGFAREYGVGQVFVSPFDVLFGEGDYMEPDVVFVGAARLHLLSDRGVEGAPDLLVEVVSPSTAQRDRGVKLERYRHFGVKEYWIVDPDARVVEVWRFGSGATEPVVLRESDRLRWTPAEDAPSLELDVVEILGKG